MFNARPAVMHDLDAIYQLYKLVAAQPVGIARSPEEVTKEYVQHFMANAAADGIELVIDHPQLPRQIVAEIHCMQPTPGIFRQVLNELTITVHPDFQGKGIGRKIFTALLDFITANRPDILRVELFVQESNEREMLYIKSSVLKQKAGSKKESWVNTSSWRPMFQWHGSTRHTSWQNSVKQKNEKYNHLFGSYFTVYSLQRGFKK